MDATREVTPLVAHAAVQAGAMLVDVREEWEYTEQRIPGSVLIPLGDLPSRVSELPSDRDIYVHCRAGVRSLRAVEYLRQTGLGRSISVGGGINSWVEAGLPVE